MMLVASHNLVTAGAHVTNYTTHLHELIDWFPGQSFAGIPGKWEEALASYDLVIVQGDYAPEKRPLLSLSNGIVLYPYYIPSKAPPLREFDYIFDKSATIVSNIVDAIGALMGAPPLTHSNGACPPAGLVHRKERKQVVIHPMSSDPNRIYSSGRFVKTARLLKKQGYRPIFAVSRDEYGFWEDVLRGEFPLPSFPTLKELAEIVYESGFFVGNESGTSHLASCLDIPTLVIAGNTKRMEMWRPGWYPGKVTTPPKWVPNVKWARLRTHKWQYFISPNKVIRDFADLVETV